MSQVIEQAVKSKYGSVATSGLSTALNADEPPRPGQSLLVGHGLLVLDFFIARLSSLYFSRISGLWRHNLDFDLAGRQFVFVLLHQHAGQKVFD
jgi:hypothetical protein